MAFKSVNQNTHCPPELIELYAHDIEHGYPLKNTTNLKRFKRTKPPSFSTLCYYVSLVVVGVFLALGIVGYSTIADVVEFLTMDHPMSFPDSIAITNLNDIELMIFEDKVQTFIDTILDGNIPADDLIIPSKILNGYIANSKYLRGHAIVSLTPHHIKFITSLPMDFFPGGKHRYLNSLTDTFVPSSSIRIMTKKDEHGNPIRANVISTFDIMKRVVDSDAPFIVAEYLTHFNTDVNQWMLYQVGQSVFGQDVPPEIITQNKKDLLAPSYFIDPMGGKVFSAIESIRIEQDQIVIHPRGTQNISYPYMDDDVEVDWNEPSEY
jgi:hypothetical protein